jgi:hypothetical protein
MTPRTVTFQAPSLPPARRAQLRGSSAARERWIAPHDPTLHERLEVAAAHLRVARRAAGGGLALWILRREIELADREILLARRSLAQVRGGGANAVQEHVLDRVSRAAAELQTSTRAAARLLDEPFTVAR